MKTIRIILFVIIGIISNLIALSQSNDAQVKLNSYEDGTKDFETIGFIKPGTTWELIALKLNDPPSSIFDYYPVIIKEWIEETEEIDGKIYMKVSWASELYNYEDVQTYYIRCEGEKVFFLNKSESNENEKLLFDYSIKQNEEIMIDGIHLGSIPKESPLIGKCKEISNKMNCNREFKMYDIDFYSNQAPQYSYSGIKWIKGIGSNVGILDNYLLHESYLSKVYDNGELVYKYPEADITNILLENIKNSKDNKKWKLDGSPFNDSEKGLYIMNGKKYIRH